MAMADTVSASALLTTGLLSGMYVPPPLMPPFSIGLPFPGGVPVIVPSPTGGLTATRVTPTQTTQQSLQRPPQPVINLGQGQALTFDPNTMQGIVTPALAQSAISKLATLRDGGMMSYSGSECRVMIESAVPFNGPIQAGNAMPGLMTKQLLELTTLTVSIHRAKAQVRAGGYINPKGIARGTRTIAGTMVMTKFTADVLLSFLSGNILPDDLSKDTTWTKIDQLPPFNLTLLFSNEYGYASFQRLTGVELVTDGSVYSIQDMLTEETVSYMATDLSPLMPLTLSNFFTPDTSMDPRSKGQKTVADLLSKQPSTKPQIINATVPVGASSNVLGDIIGAPALTLPGLSLPMFPPLRLF